MDDDPRLAPDAVRAAAEAIYAPLVGVRSPEVLDRVRRLFGTGTWPAEPRERLRVWIRERPTVEIVSIDVDTAAEAAPCAIVRVRAEARVWPRRVPAVVGKQFGFSWRRPLEAFWTLKLEPSRGWRLVRAEPGGAGAYHLRTTSQPDARALDRLRDEALIEGGAESRAARVDVDIATGLPDDPALAAEELALVDERFGIEVVEACVRRIVRAWEAASESGEPGRLDGFATPAAAKRLVVADTRALRGAEIRRIRLRYLRAVRTPPTLTVDLELHAWIGPRDTARIVLGEFGGERLLRCWRLALSTDTRQPWVLTDPDASPFRS